MTGRVEGKVAFITGAARGQAARTRCGWRKKAPTSSPSTSASRSTACDPVVHPEDLAETADLVKVTTAASTRPRSTPATSTR